MVGPRYRPPSRRHPFPSRVGAARCGRASACPRRRSWGRGRKARRVGARSLPGRSVSPVRDAAPAAMFPSRIRARDCPAIQSAPPCSAAAQSLDPSGGDAASRRRRESPISNCRRAHPAAVASWSRSFRNRGLRAASRTSSGPSHGSSPCGRCAGGWHRGRGGRRRSPGHPPPREGHGSNFRPAPARPGSGLGEQSTCRQARRVHRQPALPMRWFGPIQPQRAACTPSPNSSLTLVPLAIRWR